MRLRQVIKNNRGAAGEHRFVIVAGFADQSSPLPLAVRLDFHAIADEVIAERLRAEGVAPDAAQLASAGAFGDLGRARLVATDPALAERRHTFARAIDALDGSGFGIQVKRIETLIDEATSHLTLDISKRASPAGTY